MTVVKQIQELLDANRFHDAEELFDRAVTDWATRRDMVLASAGKLRFCRHEADRYRLERQRATQE